ncbi:MAG: addiction module toxin RelE [Candidatus Taylorbacteria bacterium CG11_big_fil_rev_8_21_14_0_20_46_11]|uniref:Addiction module toxin RelE n=1 Tax=Candidatus Taylorbacteria bacterium CG11_big_fil_rev_8_21_14_0_20_46_11 TaxID=1975025 RepID=A0A2H0KAU0_9BACT|nr:MAG: addiction module toxin RelE [Candidatus Taylorbacteria bacterium CG11_big_fil_rev_8_21_14_0_20_46_11]
MEFEYTHRAARQLGKLPRQVQKRIAEKMRLYASQDDPLEFAEHLTDYREGEYRFRFGDYRASFDVKDSRIVILKVGRRDEMY